MIKDLKLAAISEDGSPIKNHLADLNDIMPSIKKNSLSWIECVVDNVESGSKEIAKEFGIPLEPTAVLGGYYSNYEDSGDVLGITVPLINFSSGIVRPSSVLIYIAKDKIISNDSLIILANDEEMIAKSFSTILFIISRKRWRELLRNYFQSFYS